MTDRTSIIDDTRRDRHALLEALEAAGCEVRQDGRAIRCAFHEDKNPSAGVFEAQDRSAWLYRCHGSGCPASEGAWDIWRVRAHAAGRERADLVAEALRGAQKPNPIRNDTAEGTAAQNAPARRERAATTYPTAEYVAGTVPGGRLDAQYDYHDAAGRLVLVVVRITTAEGKTFRQLTPADGGLVMGCMMRPLPLYGLPALAKHPAVVVVEGEKCAEALVTLGIPATTSAMGAGSANGKGNGNAKHTDWRPLAHKRVCVWPDHDDKGRCHADEVVALLREAGVADIRRVEPGRLAVPMPPKGDVVDFLAGLGDVADDAKRAAVREVLRAAGGVGASRELAEALEDAISGRRTLVPWPWSCLTALTRALLPGAVTVIAGSPGAAKSFLTLSAIAAIHRDGHQVAILELEEARAYWLQRLIAIIGRSSDLTDPTWLARNAEQARAMARRHAADIDQVGAALWVNQTATYADVAAWVEDRCNAGARVLLVDPISVADPGGEKPWEADRSLMLRAKRCAAESGASVVFVSHPKLGPANRLPSLDAIAGGGAIPRLASTVLWVDPREDETISVRTLAHGTAPLRINRIIRVLKARNAKGTGASIGFWFDGETLDWCEQGIVVSGTRTNQSHDRGHVPRASRLASPPVSAEDVLGDAQ
jgi:hypothetical protein